ncbi:MAG: 30S ribosomal protein S20 [bacterium]
MATHQSAFKRIRQAKKSAIKNRHYRSSLKTMTKKALDTKDKNEAASVLTAATSLLDKMAQKGIIHRNKAANQKSRLAKHYNALAATA